MPLCLGGSRDGVQKNPLVGQNPLGSMSTAFLEKVFPEYLPACVITRARMAELDAISVPGFIASPAARARATCPTGDWYIGLADTFMSGRDEWDGSTVSTHEISSTNSRESVIKAQRSDSENDKLLHQALTTEEAGTVPPLLHGGKKACCHQNDGLLWLNFPNIGMHQVVVPKELRC